MSRPQGRIFVYTPSGQESGWSQDPDWFQPVRDWLFSPIAAICVWILAIGIISPGAFGLLLVLPEEYGMLLAGAGLWLVSGLVVFHWWLTPADAEHRHSEGLAVAGWHILMSSAGSGLIAWIVLFPGSVRPAFTLGELPPVIISSVVIVGVTGVIVTLLRGHRAGRMLRYAWTLCCLVSAWMALWLVSAHAGL